jgi:hypothetical protein
MSGALLGNTSQGQVTEERMLVLSPSLLLQEAPNPSDVRSTAVPRDTITNGQTMVSWMALASGIVTPEGYTMHAHQPHTQRDNPKAVPVPQNHTGSKTQACCTVARKLQLSPIRLNSGVLHAARWPGSTQTIHIFMATYVVILA